MSALEKRQPELIFKPPNPAADRGRIDPKYPGGAAEIPRVSGSR
jgi:hypothetical protein